MKITRVVTIFAALILTLLSAERVRYKRWSQTMEQLSSVKPDNGTDPSEITFTTLQPEVPTNNQKPPPNVRLGSHKRLIRVRPGLAKPFSPNELKGNRRRRQLQHIGAKSSRVTRSFELTDNHIEHQQIETLQPPDAFDKGAIHIEPIYRVTKNKNVFDWIINALRGIIDPPQSMGPLVGPFSFPGVGDKVFIRLLEPVRPDHLIVRLISHLPTTEIESSLDKSVLTPSELLSPSDHSSIKHTTIVLPKDAIIGSHNPQNDVHLISSDSLFSSSNNVMQVPKSLHPPNPQGKTSGFPKGDEAPKIYKLGLKQADVNGNPRVARHYKRNNNLPHRLQSAASESSKGHLQPLDFQAFEHPRNASTSGEVFYSRPIGPLAVIDNSQISASPLPSANRSKEFGGIGPKYSIEFASKNMRYLNLDGSVEPKDDDQVLKANEMGPILPKVSRSADRQWNPLARITASRKPWAESTAKTLKTVKRDKVLQDRSDDYNSTMAKHEFLKVDRKLSAPTIHPPWNLTTTRSTLNSREQEGKCCLHRGKEHKSAKLSVSEEKSNKTIVNNSRDNVNVTSSGSMTQKLQSNGRNATNPRNV